MLKSSDHFLFNTLHSYKPHRLASTKPCLDKIPTHITTPAKSLKSNEEELSQINQVHLAALKNKFKGIFITYFDLSNLGSGQFEYGPLIDYDNEESSNNYVTLRISSDNFKSILLDTNQNNKSM